MTYYVISLKVNMSEKSTNQQKNTVEHFTMNDFSRSSVRMKIDVAKKFQNMKACKDELAMVCIILNSCYFCCH